MGIPPIPAPDTLKGVDDLIRSSFEAFREAWFTRLLVFTALVVVGLLFEAPEIWHETIQAVRELFRSCKPARHIPAWMKLAGTVGWMLIVIGVSGEFVAESFVSKADGFVQKFDEILLAETNRAAGTAKASAEGAAKAVERAKKAAAEIEDELVRLRGEAGARRLSAKQKESFRKALEKMPTPIAVVYNPIDSEAEDFALDFFAGSQVCKLGSGSATMVANREVWPIHRVY